MPCFGADFFGTCSPSESPPQGIFIAGVSNGAPSFDARTDATWLEKSCAFEAHTSLAPCFDC